MIDVGFFHHREKLPGIGGQGLDITPLAFRVNGIKRQGRLTGTRQAGNDNQAISGYFQVDTFQVMGAGTPNTNGIHINLFAQSTVNC